jgi:hypothetical protein
LTKSILSEQVVASSNLAVPITERCGDAMPEESTTPDLLELQRESFEAANGLDFDAMWRFAAVGTWADGLVSRVTTYSDLDDARAAAKRLSEERG